MENVPASLLYSHYQLDIHYCCQLILLFCYWHCHATVSIFCFLHLCFPPTYFFFFLAHENNYNMLHTLQITLDITQFLVKFEAESLVERSVGNLSSAECWWLPCRNEVSNVSAHIDHRQSHICKEKSFRRTQWFFEPKANVTWIEPIIIPSPINRNV